METYIGMQVVMQFVVLLALVTSSTYGEANYAPGKSGVTIKNLNKPQNHVAAGGSLKLAWMYGDLRGSDVLQIFYCGYFDKGKPPLIPLAFDTTGTNFVSVYDEKPPTEERLPPDRNRLSRFFVSFYERDTETYYLELKNAHSSLGTLNISCELRYERDTNAPIVLGESSLIHVAQPPATLDTFYLGWRAMGVALLILVILAIMVALCTCVCARSERKRQKRLAEGYDDDLEGGAFEKMKQKLKDKKRAVKSAIPDKLKKKLGNEKKAGKGVKNGGKMKPGRNPPKLAPPPRPPPSRPPAPMSARSNGKPMRPPAPQTRQKAAGMPARPPPPSGSKSMRPQAPDTIKRPARPPEPRSISPGKTKPARPPPVVVATDVQRMVNRSATPNPAAQTRKGKAAQLATPGKKSMPTRSTALSAQKMGKTPTRPPDPVKAKERSGPNHPDKKPSRPPAPGVGKSRSHTNQATEKANRAATNEPKKSHSHTSTRERPGRPPAPAPEPVAQFHAISADKKPGRPPMLKSKEKAPPAPAPAPPQPEAPRKLLSKKDKLGAAYAPVKEDLSNAVVIPPVEAAAARPAKKKRLQRNQSVVAPDDLEAAIELTRKQKVAQAQKMKNQMISEEQEGEEDMAVQAVSSAEWSETKSSSHVSVDMGEESFDQQGQEQISFDYEGQQDQTFDYGQIDQSFDGQSIDYEQKQQVGHAYQSFDGQGDGASFADDPSNQLQSFDEQCSGSIDYGRQQESVDYEYDADGFPSPPDMTSFDATFDDVNQESVDWPDLPRGH